MNPHVVLFFTRGVSLRTWSMVGMLEREVALYLFLRDSGFEISFVTYGDRSELSFAGQLHGIRVLCNQSSMPLEDYERELISLHSDVLEHADIVKTNQMYGADTALAASRAMGKPLVARCGYLWSCNAARELGHNSPHAREARRVEELVFSAADRVVVTTQPMKADVIERIPQAASKIRVIPNYVDTDLFSPSQGKREKGTILFVGRIAPEKNLESLIEAIEPLNTKLVLIGEGRQRPLLQERFGNSHGRIVWEGNVPNSRLPEYLNRASLFVLPSLYEGHPKALIEAMSSGSAVLGADSPGIREIVRHGETGWLCKPDPVSIRTAVRELLSNQDLCSEMGKRARDYVLEHYALEKIGRMEADLLRETVRNQSVISSR
jgi:glycosyltransferase involved in cell wall biosynthesis